MPTTETSPLPPRLRKPTNKKPTKSRRTYQQTRNHMHFLTLATPFGRLLRAVLILFAFGVSAQRLAVIIGPGGRNDEKKWQDFKSALLGRIQNVNVVSALVLSTTAAFLTTAPGSAMANWLQPLSYLVLLGAICMAFLATACGTFLLLALVDFQAESLRQLFDRPVKFTSVLLMLALPIVLTGLAGSAVVLALMIAVWYGDNAVAKAGLTATGILALVGVLLMCWSFSWVAEPKGLRRQTGRYHQLSST
ncbi:hypothetical protein BDN67DRAFT_974544 [Paxillus ammoniavirescens]|nr:hypothetical protein BDN67DRAFT_974544 [Paxillus ammoniavirescens]